MYISAAMRSTAGRAFLQEIKGYTLAAATQVISVNALCAGIVGTVFSGWLDAFFHRRRNVLAFGFGMLNTVALCLFLYSATGWSSISLSIFLFGVAIGVLICFWAAIDIVPREAAGRRTGNRRHGELRRRRPAGYRRRLAHQLGKTGWTA